MIVQELINMIGFKLNDTQYNNVENKVGGLINKMSMLSSQMFLKVSLPIFGFLGKAAQAYSVQLDAVKMVEAGIESMGNAAGITSEEFQKMAANIQKNTLFGDEKILRDVTANLITFGNVAGDVFDRAQLAIADMSVKLKMDLKTATMMAGKALNDPIRGVTALRKNGIQFTESQENQIKTLVESNNLYDAQVIILKELERQFKGAAKSQKDASTGTITLMNAISDLFEQFGKTALPILQKMNGFLQGLAESLTNFLDKNPQLRQFLVVLMGISATIPAIVIGFKALSFLFLTVFGKMVIPLLAISTAISLLIDDFLVWKQGGESLFGSLFGEFSKFEEKLKAFKNWVTPFVEYIWKVVKMIIGGFTKMTFGLIKGDMETAEKGATTFVKGIAGESVNKWIDSAMDKIAGAFIKQPQSNDFVKNNGGGGKFGNANITVNVPVSLQGSENNIAGIQQNIEYVARQAFKTELNNILLSGAMVE